MVQVELNQISKKQMDNITYNIIHVLQEPCIMVLTLAPEHHILILHFSKPFLFQQNPAHDAHSNFFTKSQSNYLF